MNIDENPRELLEAIAMGLRNDEFKMYLQFIVDNKTKKIVSAEALSRWETSDYVLIFPGKYIGVMEESGMITTLDYLMLEKACRKLHEWEGTEFDDISISCNFTRITLSDVDFVDKVREIVERYPFERHKLTLEITEDSIETNLDVAKNNLFAAKAFGLTVALDDIGSGCTSLRNLCEYNIDLVKLDRGLLLLTNTERGKKLFHGIISLVHLLDLKLVCEGVETEEQNQLVSESDCDFIQGWYYSKGLAEHEAEDFARNYMSRF
jgi:EAL domain-containing protein (putative c-di-GMP-specific phosphodiesterase class I)